MSTRTDCIGGSSEHDYRSSILFFLLGQWTPEQAAITELTGAYILYLVIEGNGTKRAPTSTTDAYRNMMAMRTRIPRTGARRTERTALERT
ncbi:hypothetical protein Tco_0000774 [Tanacetum coccineum]